MIAILGGSGYVGKSFQKALTRHGLAFTVVSRRDIDYTDAGRLSMLLRELRPSFLINAAGYTGRPNVDACELAKTDCLAGNALLPGMIRAACEAAGTPWGHVSSGCIFTGSKVGGEGFSETDSPNFSFRQNNCSFYSGSKALGEELLQDAQQCFVWRLRIPFNEIDSPRNYISKLLRYDRLLDARNSLSQLDEFVDACVSCWVRRLPFGTYNLTNPGDVSTREVVKLIQRHNLSVREFRFFQSEAEFMDAAAKTPRSNCVLETSKMAAAGIKMAHVHDALELAMGKWKSETL